MRAEGHIFAHCLQDRSNIMTEPDLNFKLRHYRPVHSLIMGFQQLIRPILRSFTQYKPRLSRWYLALPTSAAREQGAVVAQDDFCRVVAGCAGDATAGMGT